MDAFKDGIMEGTPAIYLGKLVPKENFRVFIYAHDGSRRLVESWDEFESSMQSGLWFASASETEVIQKTKPKPRAKKKCPIIKLEFEEVAPMQEAEDMAFEVKDDFLPKG